MNSSLEITQIISQYNEFISLTKPINTSEGHHTIENILNQLEESMKLSLRDIIVDGYVEYNSHNGVSMKAKEKFIMDWPAQIITVANSIGWTLDCENLLKESGCNGFEEYILHLNETLSSIISILVHGSSNKGVVTKLERENITSYIMTSVYHRDVCSDLVRKKVESVLDYDWLCHMRYYLSDDVLNASMLNSTLEYGYEYLGRCRYTLHQYE